MTLYLRMERKDSPASGRTRSGYGARIPTGYIAKINGREHRVYCRVYSNSGTCFIRIRGEKLNVDRWEGEV